MQFASFTFLFFFLPITMGIYYLTPRRWKQEVMLGISILFLFCGDRTCAGGTDLWCRTAPGKAAH